MRLLDKSTSGPGYSARSCPPSRCLLTLRVAAAADREPRPRSRSRARPRRPPKPEKFDDTGFVTIFDGKTLDGWHVSAKTGHSRASKNKTGGNWVVEDGAIVGSQDIPGNGGIIITDKKYGNFEVVARDEQRLRPRQRPVPPQHRERQVLPGHDRLPRQRQPDGHLRRGPRRQAARPQLRLPRQGHRDQVEDDSAVPAARSTPENWPKFWKHGEWNELQARIEGNPPKITTWIKGVKFMEYHGHREAARRRGRHRPAGPRRRRLHQAVRPLPQHPREGAEEVKGLPAHGQTRSCSRSQVDSPRLRLHDVREQVRGTVALLQVRGSGGPS